MCSRYIASETATCNENIRTATYETSQCAQVAGHSADSDASNPRRVIAAHTYTECSVKRFAIREARRMDTAAGGTPYAVGAALHTGRCRWSNSCRAAIKSLVAFVSVRGGTLVGAARECGLHQVGTPLPKMSWRHTSLGSVNVRVAATCVCFSAGGDADRSHERVWVAVRGYPPTKNVVAAQCILACTMCQAQSTLH